jgi:hypothetical protein
MGRPSAGTQDSQQQQAKVRGPQAASTTCGMSSPWLHTSAVAPAVASAVADAHVGMPHVSQDHMCACWPGQSSRLALGAAQPSCCGCVRPMAGSRLCV